MSELNNLRNIGILQNLKAVEQTKFESNLLNKADKAYHDHVNEEKSMLTKELGDVDSKIKNLSRIVDELNDSLANHLRSSSATYHDYNKIRNSLKNQIDLKNGELTKLKHIQSKLCNKLKAFELSEKISDVFDEAGRHNEIQSSLKKDENIVDDTESVDSAATPTYDEVTEDVVFDENSLQKRKISFPSRDSSPPIKRKRIHIDRLMDDAIFDDYRSRITEKDDDVSSGKIIDIGSSFKISEIIWNRLFEYQKVGVKWLLQLHLNGVGGIMGDEMGLGKTIQVLAFLNGLRMSSNGRNYERSSVLIICPATVMQQWLSEFRSWAPMYRVAILHATGSGYNKPKRLIATIANEPGVLITTYTSMLQHFSDLSSHTWQYVILDEGHKIKNPDTRITRCVKEFSTSHRLILSGSPIQNNLKELWSLFDFVYPGKLGTLSSFMQNFAIPIMKGGYENATPLQVETAYRCACVIRDTINAYLLRRSKAEVEIQLPQKSEQVLFCGLTPHQISVYKEYLRSKQCKQILSGDGLAFPGLVTLRKICNHPDLVTGGPKYVMNSPSIGFALENADRGCYNYGHFSRSGKMVVVKELLKLWFKGKHKVLLFTQGRMTLRILKRLLNEEKYTFCSMDGGTPIASRHSIVEFFNNSQYDEAFVFLLTTRVGGLGLNLTGADRVLIFDPDWNPCTDLQARERAWRIGQSRQVLIYRLVISGSIEEKIYQRQVFKQFLTNRILKNPRQRRFFKTSDIRDLFQLDENAKESETSIIFEGTKYHKRLQPNFFDETALPTDIGQDDDDEYPINQNIKDLSELDAIPPPTYDNSSLSTEKVPDVNDSVVENSINQKEPRSEETEIDDDDLICSTSTLSEECLEKLRQRAKKLSKALSKLQQEEEQENKLPKVEGEFIENVKKRREYKGQNEAGTSSSIDDGQHIVATLAPRRSQMNISLSQRDLSEAQRIADKARMSLDQKLVSLGVTDKLHHDDLVDDTTPDWLLAERQMETTAKSAVSWLASFLIPRENTNKTVFGHVKNCFIWNPNEENVYFQMIDVNNQICFQGISDQDSQYPRHSRFSSSVMLAIMGNRQASCSSNNRGSKASSTVVSNEIKTLTKNIYLFLSAPARRDRATSDELISQFKTQLPTGQNALFKGLLNEMCSFHRRNGIWRLKPEFRNYNKDKK